MNDLTNELIERQFVLNKLHPVYLLKALMDEGKLMNQAKRSAVVITSSGLS